MAPPVHPTFTCEVCVLAGGLSKRMGLNKSRLRLGPRTMLGQIRAAASEIGLSVRVIRRDLVPRCGPLGGIFTGLTTSRTETVLFLACDMPFVSAELLGRMLQGFDTARRARFVREGGWAGFPFLLRRYALPVVANQIAQTAFSLQQLAARLKAQSVRLPRQLSRQLLNINTPGDLKDARRRAELARERTRRPGRKQDQD